MNARDWRNIALGLAAGLVGAKLVPAISKAARPLLRTFTTAAIELSLQARSALARTRDELENIVAEARYERDIAQQEVSTASPAADSEPRS